MHDKQSSQPEFKGEDGCSLLTPDEIEAGLAADRQRFIADLVVRGEVAEPGADLEPGMTHEATGELDDTGQPVVERRRFNIY